VEKTAEILTSKKPKEVLPPFLAGGFVVIAIRLIAAAFLLPWWWYPGRFRDYVAESALQRLIREHDWPGSPARGRVEGCFLLGDVHLNLAYLAHRLRGNGWESSTRQHFLEAENLYLSSANVPTAAQRQSFRPETKCGILYTSLLNPKHNLETAFDFFQQAHHSGCMHGTYWLGRAYLNGFGIGGNPTKGANLIMRGLEFQPRGAACKV
jgi:hypothetical protein